MGIWRKGFVKEGQCEDLFYGLYMSDDAMPEYIYNEAHVWLRRRCSFICTPLTKLRRHFLLFIVFTHISSNPSFASESGNLEMA